MIEDGNIHGRDSSKQKKHMMHSTGVTAQDKKDERVG